MIPLNKYNFNQGGKYEKRKKGLGGGTIHVAAG